MQKPPQSRKPNNAAGRSSNAAERSSPDISGSAHYLPYFVFAALTYLPSLLPKGEPWDGAPLLIYALKTILTGWLLWHFRKYYTELKFDAHWSAPLAGVAVIIVWVGLNPYYPHLGSGWTNPTVVDNDLLRSTAVFFRLLGSVLVVPVMEELFFRSWMARWIINPDFSRVKLGAFTWISVIVTTALFSISHFHWLPAIFAGLVFHGYVLWKKRLGDAIVAHGVANLALGVYVLAFRRWDFW